jgi:hypothetical protein
VDDVEVWQDTPHAVDLGVVPVDLGNHQEDEAEGDGRSEPSDERVRIDVELLQAINAPNIAQNLVREAVQLGDERLDRLGEVGAVLDGLEEREGHSERNSE